MFGAYLPSMKIGSEVYPNTNTLDISSIDGNIANESMNNSGFPIGSSFKVNVLSPLQVKREEYCFICLVIKDL